MAQLHFYVPEEIAEELRRRAEARGLSTSKFIAELVTKELDGDWPPGFFEEVVGAWKGEPLERPEQLPYEKREELDVPPRH
jgi:ribbon-helix-helix CopG family protein